MPAGSPNVLFTVVGRNADDLLGLSLEADWHTRVFRGTQLSGALSEALAAPPLPSAAIIDCSVDHLIDYARQIRASASAAHLIFACSGEQAEQLPQTVRAFPTIGRHWAVVSRGPKFAERIKAQLEVTARRQRHRTTLDRVNVRLQQLPPVDARMVHRLVISERYLAAIVANAPDAIVTLSSNLEVLAWNASAGALWHAEPAESLGRTFDQFLEQSCRGSFREMLREAARTGQFIRREFRALNPLGSVPIELTVTPVFAEDAGPIAFTVIARDITLRKAAEESARERADMLERLVNERTARLRETINQLEQFSYTVSHDLRGPLRAMQGYADALLKDHGGELHPQAKGYAERIARAAVRMDRLTQDVLAYSKVATVALQKRVIELDLLVPELAIQICGEERAAHVFEIRQPLLAVIGHDALLAQALANLMNNSIKFVAPGTAPHVRIWTERRGRHVRLFVADSGIGIPEEHRPRIFDMFERGGASKEYDGTGVGLAIVKKSVERLGGEVGFTSEPHHGTTFWIELTAAP